MRLGCRDRRCIAGGEVCVSRRQGRRHHVLPLSADIHVRARRIGFDVLTPIAQGLEYQAGSFAIDTPRGRGAAETWIDYFESRLGSIAIRKAPLWNQGLLEGAWVVRIDTRNPPGQRVVDPVETHNKGIRFFRALLSELYLREPTLRPPLGQPGHIFPR